MEILWRWTTIVIFTIISQTTLTQNINNKWNNNFNHNLYNNNNNNQDSKISDNFRNLNLETATKNNYNNINNLNKLEKEKINYDLNDHDKPHSRQKRLIWVTDDGRLALPPGTTLSISPTIALPFVRYPPEGFLSNMTISLPLTIDFDKLGLTDNQNPLGTVPDYLGRSMGRAAGSMLGQYVAKYLNIRKKRSITENEKNQQMNENFKIYAENIEKPKEEEIPKLPEEHKHAFHGGERAILYTVVEDFLSNFGLDGKACLLRAICEVHSKPVNQLGLLGEMLKLFFTASKSPFSELLDEYVSAEKMGGGHIGPGECFPYYKECPKSIFKLNKNRYHNNESKHSQQDIETNEINTGNVVM